MKLRLSPKVSLFLLLPLLILGCSLDGKFEYTYEDGNCLASQEGQDYFKQTAEWLTIYRIYNDPSIDSIYQDLDYFPKGMVQGIQTRLAKIFDINDLPERDTVIELYDLASKHIIESYKMILLSADPEEPWISNLIDGEVPTGNPTFDELYLKFQFEVDRVSSNNSKIFLKSNEEALFNVYKVIDRIKTSPHSTGIKIITDNVSPTEKIRIQLEISETEDYYFTFRHGWGDCPRGCLYNRYWSFKVGEDCKVEFLGTSGDQLPD